MKSLPHELPPVARVALYPRVSGPKQVKDGYGLGYQETEMHAAAEEQGAEIVEVVSDPAFERDEWNRPGLDRLRLYPRTSA